MRESSAKNIRFIFQSQQNTHQSNKLLNIKKRLVFLKSTIPIWQSQSNLPPLTWLDSEVNLKTNPSHVHFNPQLYLPLHHEQDKSANPKPLWCHSQKAAKLCFIPKKSWAPFLAQNNPFREHWTYSRFTGYRSRLAGFWLGGRAGIAFASILYVAHLGAENRGHWSFEALLLPSEHSDFMPVAHP